MQLEQPVQTQSASFEELLAANFESCLAAQRERRLRQEYGNTQYGWNNDLQRHEPTRDDQIDMQGEQVIERDDFVAHHGDFPF